MSTISLSTTVTGGGLSVAFTRQVSANVTGGLSPSLPAAKTGTLTTRTDNNTGTLTMSSGHGITDGQRIDIFWLDPTTGEQKCQHKVTVGTVATNSVPFDLGVGDNLPDQGTAVTVQVAAEYDFPITTSELVALAVGGSAGGKVVLEKGDGTVVFHQTLSTTGAGSSWASGSGVSNPVSDTVTKAYLTNASAAAANTVNVLVGTTG